MVLRFHSLPRFALLAVMGSVQRNSAKLNTNQVWFVLRELFKVSKERERKEKELKLCMDGWVEIRNRQLVSVRDKKESDGGALTICE